MSASSRLFFILFLFFVVAMFLTQARASVFEVGGQDQGFVVSYPDTWASVSNQLPDEQLTVLAPGSDDQASCRVRVRDDQRFQVYPHNFAKSIQQVYYGKDFWNNYVREYDAGAVMNVQNGVMLGSAYASRAEATYTTAQGVDKRAVLMAGVYNGRAYILDCSAVPEAFDHWQADFGLIMASFHPTVIGNGTRQSYYRDFTQDPLLVINRQAHDERTLYY